jgi:hypothetical protein
MTRRVLGLWMEEPAAKYVRYVQYIEEVMNMGGTSVWMLEGGLTASH